MRYEYFTVQNRLNPMNPDLLAQYGAEGWELCGFTFNSVTDCFVYIFKRGPVITKVAKKK